MGFRHLCNLLQTASGDIDAVIANLTDIKEEQIGRFKERCICAWNWIRECSPEDFRFCLRSNGEKIALEDAELKALQRVAEEVLPQVEVLEEKPLSQLLYDIAKDEGIEPKALFTVLYQALIEKDQGPRLASFMKIIGKEKLQTLLSIYT
jgi:lysyl-tRNA synthetase class 1